MRIFEKQRVRRIEEVVVDIRCNKCGESRFASAIGVYDIHPFSVDNGFGDKFDGITHEFDLCDKCYVKIIKSFKHAVTSKENIW